MLSFKAFRLNKMINTGGTEQNCGTYQLWVREEKGMRRIRFNPKKKKNKQHKEVTIKK